MKTVTLAIFLIALVTAQAGIVDYVLNRTSLTGKATFNTTNGLNLGYNGSLTYNLGGKTIPILGLGVSFDATPEVKKVGDTTNATVKYNGAISVVDGGVGSNVTVSGATTLTSTLGVKQGNITNITFAQTISDTNSFAVRTGTTVVTGKSNTGLTATGVIAQNGSRIKVSEDVALDATVRGTVSTNGTSLGAFTVTRNSKAHVKEGVLVNASATGKQPLATFGGRVGFTDDKTFAFQGTTYNQTKQGGARFGGHTWLRNGNGTTGVAVAEKVGYGYGEKVAVNGTVVAKSIARGVAAVYHAQEVNTTATGATVEAFQAGKIRHFQNTYLPGNNTNKTHNRTRKPSGFVEMIDDSDIAMTEESSVEFIAGKPMNKRNSSRGCHHNHSRHHKGIKTFLEAGWKSGTQTTVTVTGNNTNTVDSHNAVIYGVRGWDSQTKKPWEFAGNRTFDATVKNTVGSNFIDDITIQSSDNQDLVNKLAKMPDPKLDAPKTHMRAQSKPKKL